MLPAVLFLGIFSVGSATSKNLISVFITRFLGGVFGSAPVSSASAALSDLYAVKARGAAVNCVAVVIAGGPILGPLIGSALVNNPTLGWRCRLPRHRKGES
jgi:DHA1 family multidrug resistance protein-like MFS transporter